MPKVQIVTLENARPVEGPKDGRAPLATRAYFDKQSDPLHMRLQSLGSGATLAIRGLETDFVAYVWQGAVFVEDTRLAERASLIVEKGASVTLTAGADGASVLVFNLNGRPANARAGGHVHLLPSERVPRVDDLAGAGTAGGALHADAGCPTCELWLHENDFHIGGYEVAVHSHTEDEVIFVRAGSMRLGNRLYGPGTALAIAANTKYGFHAGPEGLSFVNFRAAPPFHVSANGANVMDEAKFWRAEAGVPNYLEARASSTP